MCPAPLSHAAPALMHPIYAPTSPSIQTPLAALCDVFNITASPSQLGTLPVISPIPPFKLNNMTATAQPLPRTCTHSACPDWPSPSARICPMVTRRSCRPPPPRALRAATCMLLPPPSNLRSTQQQPGSSSSSSSEGQSLSGCRDGANAGRQTRWKAAARSSLGPICAVSAAT